MLKLLTTEQKEVLFLDYVNNFLSVEAFAEHWQISEILANDIINEVRNEKKRIDEGITETKKVSNFFLAFCCFL